MPKLPVLPSAIVAALGVIGTALVVIEPSLSSPWREIDAAVLAVLTAAGVLGARASARAHAAKVAIAVRSETPR